jgi:hypothetical protein
LRFEQVGHRSSSEQVSAEGYSSVVIAIYTPFGQWSADEDHQETAGLAGDAVVRDRTVRLDKDKIVEGAASQRAAILGSIETNLPVDGRLPHRPWKEGPGGER